MYSDEDLLPLSALQHLVYCPRQCALIHVERLWAENQWTAEGRVLHERAHREQTRLQASVRVARGVAIRSFELGVSGQADVVEFHPPENVPFPIEYKRGRPKSHEADRVQLCAQAICLEEMLQRPVLTGALFYGRTRHRKDVEFDEPLRASTRTIAAEVHKLIAEARTPAARYEKGKCGRCSLRTVCLPETLVGSESASRYIARSLTLTLDAAAATDW